MRLSPIIALALAALTLAACDPTLGRAEFAPPEDRWPSSEPSTALRETPAPAVPIHYCYRSLAATDCFLSPQKDRPGFTGVYPIPGRS
jgi:hypothetical protein